PRSFLHDALPILLPERKSCRGRMGGLLRWSAGRPDLRPLLTAVDGRSGRLQGLAGHVLARQVEGARFDELPRQPVADHAACWTYHREEAPALRRGLSIAQIRVRFFTSRWR